jgi:signal transduction histidine kinase
MWKKVIGPTILVSLLWIAGSSITNHEVHRVYEYHSRVMEENVSTIRAAWGMQDALWRLQAVVVEAPRKDHRETRVEAGELESAFQQHLEEAKKTAFTQEEKALVNSAQEHFAVYRSHIDARVQSSELVPLPPPQNGEMEKTIRLARAVAEPCRRLVELNERILADSTLRSARLSTAVNLIRLAFLIAGPLVGVLCGLWVARGLHRSISQISVTLRDATGDLSRDMGSVEVQSLADLPGLHQQVQTVAGRLRQVMEELHQTRHQAMSAERLAAVGELAAGVAHELRNPLTSVKLLIQTAVQRQHPPVLSGKQLQVVEQEVARMENTIQGLLDFARPPELHRLRHDLRTTVRRALNLVDGRAKSQNVTMVEQLPETPVMVDGDPEQLHQIFVNLLLNGIEAMPQGGSLTVAIRSGDTGGVCRVSVSDSGCGIPQPVLDRIFEPFVTSKEHGTGLGLAVSHRIAAEHGGTLLASNRAEGGAVFTLDLPLSTEAAGGTTRQNGQPSQGDASLPIPSAAQ